MSDSEINIELLKINANFAHVHNTLEVLGKQTQKTDIRLELIDQRLNTLQDTVEGSARSTAEGFQEVDERFDRLDVKLQNQIDGIAERKVDRTEFAPIKAQVLNLRKR